MNLIRRITEGEVQFLVRSFLLKNNFRLYTKTTNEEPLHYRNTFTNPPKFKNPDHVAIKGNAVLVFEDKVKFSDLFAGKHPDLIKISSFLANTRAVAEFRTLLADVEPAPTNPVIVGSFASLAPEKSKKEIPKKFVFIGIKEDAKDFVVELLQDAGFEKLFEHSSCQIGL